MKQEQKRVRRRRPSNWPDIRLGSGLTEAGLALDMDSTWATEAAFLMAPVSKASDGARSSPWEKRDSLFLGRLGGGQKDSRSTWGMANCYTRLENLANKHSFVCVYLNDWSDWGNGRC